MFTKEERRIYDRLRWLDENNKLEHAWSVYFKSFLRQHWSDGLVFDVCLVDKKYFKAKQNELKKRKIQYTNRYPTNRIPGISDSAICYCINQQKEFSYRITGYAA